MNSGEIVKSDGHEYQAVTLNVNGVTKRILVPLNSDDVDFIPTPDNPLPVSKAPTEPSPRNSLGENKSPSCTVRQLLRKEGRTPVRSTTGTTVINPIRKEVPIAIRPALGTGIIRPTIRKEGSITLGSTPGNVRTIQLQQVRSSGQQNTVQIPLNLTLGVTSAGVLAQNSAPITLSNVTTGLTVPQQTQFNPVPVSLPTVFSNNTPPQVMTAGTIVPIGNQGKAPSVIQAGTLIQPSNPKQVQFGNAVNIGPTTALKSNPGLQLGSNPLPASQVYQLDSTGRLKVVSSLATSPSQTGTSQVQTQPILLPTRQITPVQLSGTTVRPISGILRPQLNTVRTDNAGVIVPQNQPPQQNNLTLRTPDGKVFSVPNHLLPTTVATAISPVAQPLLTPTQSLVGNSNVFTISVSKTGTQSTLPVVQPASLQTVSSAVVSDSNTNTRTGNILPCSSVSTVYIAPGINVNGASFINVTPNPVPKDGAIRMPSLKPITTNKTNTDKLPGSTYDTKMGTKASVYKDISDISPKARYKDRDKEYQPPPLQGRSWRRRESSRRRRSARIKTKPCSVILKRLNLKRRAVVNLNEVPYWTL